MSLEPWDTEVQQAKRPWISIVIPAHNEGAYLEKCLESFASQTRPPDELVVVDDNSTDNTADIARDFTSKHHWIKCIHHNSEQGHYPGAKVIRAFNFGLTHIANDFDLVGKFDADVVLPITYFGRILHEFHQNNQLGMCSGLVYVKNREIWNYEPIADTNHVRGPVKCYSRACFEVIGGLQPAIGWDTADALLARYHGFEVKTLPALQVKHLRSTGAAYSRENAFKQGQTLYTLRYGVVLGLLASLKMAWKRRSFILPWHHLRGCFYAWRNKLPVLLSADAARFARSWRWEQIKNKLL